jgi:hypothetical protein
MQNATSGEVAGQINVLSLQKLKPAEMALEAYTAIT